MPSSPLRVAAAQPLVIRGDLSGNLERHAELVESSGAHLVVFPEMSATGYHLDAEPVVPDDGAFSSLISVCRATGSTALIGAPVEMSGLSE